MLAIPTIANLEIFIPAVPQDKVKLEAMLQRVETFDQK